LLGILIGLLCAAVFWFLLFGIKIINFWWGMAIAAGLLAVWSIVNAREFRKRLFRFNTTYCFWGVLSAVILYAIFWLGNIIAIKIFPFAADQINAVYFNKSQLDIWEIAILLFFWIGPAEEIFWRGMIQRTLANYFGAVSGWIVGALIYGAVHLWAANLMLFISAIICGLYWGWLYKKFGSLWPGIISHAIWDILIFLIFPLNFPSA
jgi:uncharacterized protein